MGRIKKQDLEPKNIEELLKGRNKGGQVVGVSLMKDICRRIKKLESINQTLKKNKTARDMKGNLCLIRRLIRYFESKIKEAKK